MVFNGRIVPVFMLWLPKISGSGIEGEINALSKTLKLIFINRLASL